MVIYIITKTSNDSQFPPKFKNDPHPHTPKQTHTSLFRGHFRNENPFPLPDKEESKDGT